METPAPFPPAGNFHLKQALEFEVSLNEAQRAAALEGFLRDVAAQHGARSLRQAAALRRQKHHNSASVSRETSIFRNLNSLHSSLLPLGGLNRSFEVDFGAAAGESGPSMIPGVAGSVTVVNLSANDEVQARSSIRANVCSSDWRLWSLPVLLQCTQRLLELPSDETLLLWQLTRTPLAHTMIMDYGYYTEHIVRDGETPWPHPDVVLVSDPAKQQAGEGPPQRRVPATRLSYPTAGATSNPAPTDGYAASYLHAVRDRNVIAPWQSKRASAFLYGVCMVPPAKGDCASVALPSAMDIHLHKIETHVAPLDVTSPAVAVCVAHLREAWRRRGANSTLPLDAALSLVPCLLSLDQTTLAATVKLKFDVQAPVAAVRACTGGKRTLLWGLSTCPMAGTLGTPHPLTAASRGSKPTAGTRAGGPAQAAGNAAYRKTAELSPGHIPQLQLEEGGGRVTATLQFQSTTSSGAVTMLSAPQYTIMVTRAVVAALLFVALLAGCGAVLAHAKARSWGWMVANAQLTLIAMVLVLVQLVCNLAQVLLAASWLSTGAGIAQLERLHTTSRLLLDAQMVLAALLVLALGTGFQSSWWLPTDCGCCSQRTAARSPPGSGVRAAGTRPCCCPAPPQSRGRGGQLCWLPPGAPLGAIACSVKRQLALIAVYAVAVLFQRLILPPPFLPLLVDKGGGATSPLLWKDQHALALRSTWSTYNSDMSGADWLFLLASSGGFCAGDVTADVSSATCKIPANLTSSADGLPPPVHTSIPTGASEPISSFDSESASTAVALGAGKYNTFWQWAAGTAVITPGPTAEHVYISVMHTVLPSMTGVLFFFMILLVPNTVMAYMRLLDVHTSTIFSTMQRESLASATNVREVVQHVDVLPFLPSFAQRQVLRRVFLAYAALQLLCVCTWILGWLPALVLRFPAVIFGMEEACLGVFLVFFMHATQPAMLRLHPRIQQGISEHLTLLLRSKLQNGQSGGPSSSTSGAVPSGGGYPSHLRQLPSDAGTKRPVRGLMRLLLPGELKVRLGRQDDSVTDPDRGQDSGQAGLRQRLHTIGPTRSLGSNSSSDEGGVDVGLGAPTPFSSTAAGQQPTTALHTALQNARTRAVRDVQRAAASRPHTRQDLDAMAWPWVHVPTVNSAPSASERSDRDHDHLPAPPADLHTADVACAHAAVLDGNYEVSMPPLQPPQDTGAVSLPGWTPPDLLRPTSEATSSTPGARARNPWRRSGDSPRFAFPWRIVPSTLVQPSSREQQTEQDPHEGAENEAATPSATPPPHGPLGAASRRTAEGAVAISIDDSMQSGSVQGGSPLPTPPPHQPLHGLRSTQEDSAHARAPKWNAWVLWQGLRQAWGEASGPIMRRVPQVDPQRCGLELLLLSTSKAQHWSIAPERGVAISAAPSASQPGTVAPSQLPPSPVGQQRHLSSMSDARDGSYIVTPRGPVSASSPPGGGPQSASSSRVRAPFRVSPAAAETPARGVTRSWGGGVPELHVRLNTPSILQTPTGGLLLATRRAVVPAAALSGAMDAACGRVSRPPLRSTGGAFAGMGPYLGPMRSPFRTSLVGGSPFRAARRNAQVAPSQAEFGSATGAGGMLERNGSDSDSRDESYSSHGHPFTGLPWALLRDRVSSDATSMGVGADHHAHMVNQINDYLRVILGMQAAAEDTHAHTSTSLPRGRVLSAADGVRTENATSVTGGGLTPREVSESEPEPEPELAVRSGTDMSVVSADTMALHDAIMRMLLGGAQYPDSSALEYQRALHAANEQERQLQGAAAAELLSTPARPVRVQLPRGSRRPDFAASRQVVRGSDSE